MATRSYELERMICEGELSEDSLTRECLNDRFLDHGESVEDSVSTAYFMRVCEQAESVGREVTYAVANSVLWIFIGTEGEVLNKFLVAGVMSA